jgi:hypothetical protein
MIRCVSNRYKRFCNDSSKFPLPPPGCHTCNRMRYNDLSPLSVRSRRKSSRSANASRSKSSSSISRFAVSTSAFAFGQRGGVNTCSAPHTCSTVWMKPKSQGRGNARWDRRIHLLRRHRQLRRIYARRPAPHEPRGGLHAPARDSEGFGGRLLRRRNARGRARREIATRAGCPLLRRITDAALTSWPIPPLPADDLDQTPAFEHPLSQLACWVVSDVRPPCRGSQVSVACHPRLPARSSRSRQCDSGLGRILRSRRSPMNQEAGRG